MRGEQWTVSSEQRVAVTVAEGRVGEWLSGCTRSRQQTCGRSSSSRLKGIHRRTLTGPIYQRSSRPGGSLLNWVIGTFVLLWITTVVQGKVLGTCWSRLTDGTCGKVVKPLATRDECCSATRGLHHRSWSNEFHDPSKFLLSPITHSNNSVIADLPTCEPCASSCEGVLCGEDKKCVIRKGSAKCVCNPKCHLKKKAPVCGSDGRTYSSECQLLKRACRKKKRLMIAHDGSCQTCSGVRCGHGKQCVLDEQLRPQCVRCPRECPSMPLGRMLCAADGNSYMSSCHLKLASCQAGRLILRAYKGLCRGDSRCEDVRCWRDQRCLTVPHTGNAQCTWCGSPEKCIETSRSVCGSDGQLYPSWCALRHKACISGKAILAMPHTHCAKDGCSTLPKHSEKPDSDLSRDHRRRLKQKRLQKEKLLEELRRMAAETDKKSHRQANVIPRNITEAHENFIDTTSLVSMDKENNKYSKNNFGYIPFKEEKSKGTKKKNKRKRRKDCRKDRRSKRGKNSKAVGESIKPD